MQLRRLPFLLVALYVLLSLVPQNDAVGIRSVCRMTGMPMTAEAIVLPTTIRPCCARTPRIAAVIRVGKSLCSPSCCVIRASSGAPFVARVADCSVTDLFALLPQPLDPVIFVTTSADKLSGDIDQRSPRGPPLRSGPSRAPPFLS